MKQLFIQDGRVVIEDLSPPPLDSRGILVETRAAAISIGTESRSVKGSTKTSLSSLKSSELLHLVLQKYSEGTLWPALRKKILKPVPVAPPRLSYGSPTGYSCAGQVLEVGAMVGDLQRNIQPGDRVACAGSPHAEVVYVPKNLFVPIPENVSDVEASFVSLGSIALHALRQAGLTSGETIVVMGLGVIGQLAEQIARASGLRSIAIDFVSSRVEISRNNGAHLALNPSRNDILAEVMNFTEGVGADAVLLCTGGKSSEPIKQAINLVRHRARIVMVGTSRMDIPRAPFYQKEIELRIARSYGPGRYDPQYEQEGQDYPLGYVRWTERRNMSEFLRLVSERRVDVESLVTRRFPFIQATKAYQVALGDPRAVLGVVLTRAGSKAVNRSRPTIHAVKRRIGVAVIGAGNFARAYHLPNISKVPGLEMKAVVANHTKNAKRVANEFGVPRATTNFGEMLREPSVELMVISTPHNLHASQSIAALDHGKAVFCEKPMGMNQTEVDQVVDAVRRTGGFYAIGFNRRFSPVVLRARELLAGRKGSLVLNYRVMGAFAPADHWVYDPVRGGGRIIGESCHFFDLLCHFVDARPVLLSAIGGTISHPGTQLDDNLICSLTFNDGSIASLVYGDLGSAEYPKEHLEIFSGEGVITINDFRDLSVFGFSGQRGMLLPMVDKGHKGELVAISDAMLKGKPSPIDALTGRSAMRCAFAAIASLRSGEPQILND